MSHAAVEFDADMINQDQFNRLQNMVDGQGRELAEARSDMRSHVVDCAARYRQVVWALGMLIALEVAKGFPLLATIVEAMK